MSKTFSEISLLRDLKHSNIVTLHDIIHTQKTITLVFEYLDWDLKHFMEQCQGGKFYIYFFKYSTSFQNSLEIPLNGS